MSGSKEDILNCARDLFLEEGLSHFSMRKVATCVGFSATALYRHYANKEALLFNVLLQGLRIFSDYLNRVDEGQEPMACLEATTVAYLDFALDEHAYYEMMFMSSEQMTGLKKLNEGGADEIQQTFAILQHRVQNAIDAGVLRAADSFTTAYAIWSFAHGQISLYLCGRTGLKREQFVALYRQLMTGQLRKL